jgi:hypothetical protein
MCWRLIQPLDDMSRSNFPQALSVVAVTHQGQVELTAAEITKFDGIRVGFSHERTWSAMPYALQGKFTAEAVLRQLGGVHPRVAASISALCALGESRPVETFKFADHPGAGLKEVQGLRLGPDVTILAKASCWYMNGDVPVIPVLQPRLSALIPNKLGIYASLARRAFCQGDWVDAVVEIVDLSERDSDGTVVAKIFTEADLTLADDSDLNAFLATYVEAQKLAATIRARKAEEEKAKEPRRPSLKKGDSFDLFSDDEEPR